MSGMATDSEMGPIAYLTQDPDADLVLSAATEPRAAFRRMLAREVVAELPSAHDGLWSPHEEWSIEEVSADALAYILRDVIGDE